MRLDNPSSIFDLHRLNSLSRLYSVVLANTPLVDLKPLSFVPSLRNLDLDKVEHYASLPSLSQLRSLWLMNTVATPAVLQMKALTQLGLSDCSQAGSLSQLRQLAFLSVTRSLGAEDWTDDDFAALTAVMDAAPPALVSLSCSLCLHPPLPSLMRLRELLLWCDGMELYPESGDFRQLTGLKTLGFSGYCGELHLQSASVTALCLINTWESFDDDDVSFPCLRGCSMLEHVMLTFVTDVTITAEQLPPKAMTLWTDHDLNKIKLEAKAAELVRVRRVKNLTWGSDPARLEAELKQGLR